MQERLLLCRQGTSLASSSHSEVSQNQVVVPVAVGFRGGLGSIHHLRSG